MAPRLRPATEADLPAIRALRREVGWQVSPWALHDAMHAPNTAFYALEDEGHLVAVGSGIAYGRLGVVGNMIVAPDRRREGLGSRVLLAAIAGLGLRPDFATHPTHENAAGRAWLEDLGGRVRRTDGRMSRGPDIARRLDLIYGNVVGALG